MIIHKELIPGTGLGYPFCHLHSPLVVAVKEIGLPAFYTHARIFLAGLCQVLVQNVKHGPKNNAYALSLSVVYQFLEVDVGNGVHNVTLGRVIPALVEHHIGNMVLGGKVDIILIGTRVNARLEIHSLQVPVVPPVPGHLAGFHPTDITYLVGRGQRKDQIVHRHLGVLLRNGHHTPGIGSCAR